MMMHGAFYGASGWGRHRNESVFEPSTTVNHAKKTETHLSEHYTSDEIERKVENICRDDYDNKFLDLEVSYPGFIFAYVNCFFVMLM